MTKKTSKREMRIVIAKDVLKQLRNGTYSAYGTYFETLSESLLKRSVERRLLTNEEVQKAALKLEHCQVCAIGAAFISGVRIYDGISGNEFDVENGKASIGAQHFFTKQELKTMESMFEVWGTSFSYELGIKLDRLPRKRRMRIVFQSIIDNDGRVSGRDIIDRFRKARVPKRN